MMKYLNILLIVVLLTGLVYGDGLLLPNEEEYPTNFLRSRVTEINAPQSTRNL